MLLHHGGIDVGLVEPKQAAKKPPATYDVHHQPIQPKPDEAVLVTARLAAGTTKATLKLQAVAPGKYVRKSDPAYEKDWTDLPMRDDGQEGDAQAGWLACAFCGRDKHDVRKLIAGPSVAICDDCLSGVAAA